MQATPDLLGLSMLLAEWDWQVDIIFSNEFCLQVQSGP